MKRNPDVTRMRDALIFECKEKHMLDPREYDLNDDHNVQLTLSIGEIRRFLVATAITSEECAPVKPQ